MPTEIEVLRAQVELLRECFEVSQGAISSALQVANREGKDTNWPAYRAMLRHAAETNHAALNALPKKEHRHD